ncbi:hypothetical protein [Stakelama saccharophila]|uniref:Uncharacterized protein n=1 Tax=Stakelama saccharophila TaxID=3075605 RepID=A0ABZ0BCI8_9SPHN|nr:hypothetical protein [Stakelama sp. W311]WNO54945.1 hypothetical protein RPR59_06790 [Stakelama sp. W311]
MRTDRSHPLHSAEQDERLPLALGMAIAMLLSAVLWTGALIVIL